MEASTERHPERAASRVILKPIDEALKNGDVIRAVIRNTGINHDGKTPGVTFPSAKAQEELARKVYVPVWIRWKQRT